jgi:thiamine-phosphate pyrophosphorylase
MYRNREKEMKLAIITNPYAVKNETGMINRFFAEGLDEIHIRKPKTSVAEMKKYISQIDPEFHHKIVLHDCYSLVNNFDIHKIHLSRNWLFNPATSLYLNVVLLKGKKVSRSMTISNCKMLYKPVEGIDEFVLGPVLASFTYFTDNRLIKTESQEKALRHSKLPVTAIGGVSSETLEFFQNVGFSGIAMQSSIWKSMDPMGSFLEIRDHYAATRQELRIAV